MAGFNMARSSFRPFGKLFLFVLTVSSIVCFSLSASAQPNQGPNVVAGCDPNVWNALTAKADAQVAYDVAVTRQMINKPDSVLTLTCFDQAAGVSANVGGAIFSRSFAGPLGLIMPVAPGGYNCTAIGDLWNTIATGGINTGAPYVTFDDLLSDQRYPNPTNDYEIGWNAAQSQGVFANLKSKVAALPGPPQAMDFSGAKSSCDVLKIAGILQGDCPAVGGQGGGP